jgi:plastocyanin
MQKALIIGLIVIVLIVGAAFIFGGDKNTTDISISTSTSTASTASSTGTITGTVESTSSASSNSTSTSGSGSTASVKTFNVAASNFKFSLSEMRVKKGDTVTINVTNTGGFHDVKIDEFNVATKRLQDGQTDTVTFVADKTGTFEFYCSVGTHRQMGMRGNLIVE